jgi:Mg2+ and Co2+ transporter CorA
LLQTAKDLKEHADSLNDALTGLMGIVSNPQAGREAKTVKILTIVALVFIPLSFTSGLFSMENECLPGEGRFWMF